MAAVGGGGNQPEPSFVPVAQARMRAARVRHRPQPREEADLALYPHTPGLELVDRGLDVSRPFPRRAAGGRQEDVLSRLRTCAFALAQLPAPKAWSACL